VVCMLPEPGIHASCSELPSRVLLHCMFPDTGAASSALQAATNDGLLDISSTTRYAPLYVGSKQQAH